MSCWDGQGQYTAAAQEFTILGDNGLSWTLTAQINANFAATLSGQPGFSSCRCDLYCARYNLLCHRLIE